MRYVIVGCGRVGATLAKLLCAEDHDVTVVDLNPSAFKRLGGRFPGRCEVGTGIDSDVLARAGCRETDGFAAVTDGDNRNVMAALIAQRLFHVKKIVARIYDPPRGQIYRDLGIETFCPTTIGAKIVRDRLLHAPFVSQPSFDFGRVSSITITLADVEPGLTVAHVERVGLVRVAAVRSANGKVTVPRPEDALRIGDEINAIVAPEALADFATRFAHSKIEVAH